jgi:dienelactone hydrolase
MQCILSSLGVILGLACLARGSEEPRAPVYPDHANLQIYLDDRGQSQPITSAADWAIRRRHILAGMQQAMGVLPDRANLPPLDIRTTDEVQENGARRQTISFDAGDGNRITAYLFLPDALLAKTAAARRLPALLALHQTATVGKGDTAGLGASTSRAYATELAARGYIVLAPDYPSFGDSQGYDFQSDRYQSGTMKGIFNHMRSVDLLTARDDVDAQRIGAIGHSLGGHNAMFVGVFDPRLKVIVSSCGWTPFHDYYGGKIAGWTSDRYMPRLRDEYGLDADRVPFDFYEVVAALAPRAFFSNSPLHDNNFDVTGVKKGITAAAAVYNLLDAPDQLQARYPDCGHDFPTDIRREAYTFIDKVLEHKPVKEVP